jgi:FkbM family methyltransferase
MFLKIARKVVHSVRGRRIAAMRGQPQWCKVPAGFWMYVDPNEYLGRAILLGYAESHLVYFIKQVIREGDVCVDVGANQGYIALHLARGVGSDGRVVAIEPIEPIFQRLQANIEYNRAHQVICVQSAAGDCVQTVDMWYNPAESILSSVHHRSSAQAIRVRVQQEPVDSILERLLTSTQLDKLILVKIDVEGYEPMVLKGLQQTLRRSKPLLWMEKNPNHLQEGGFTTLDMVAPLHELGYNIYDTWFSRNFLGMPRLTLTPVNIHGERFNTEYRDILAVDPGSEGWERLQGSRVRISEAEV